MDFSELLNALQNLTKEKILKKDVAKCLNFTTPNYIRREYEHQKLTNEQYQKISEYFNVDVDDLKNYNHKVSVSDDFINIPVFGDVYASCGYGAIIDNESQTAIYPIAAPILKFLGANEKDSQIIFATGDSMEPEIKHGDALMIDKSKREIVDGQIYIIRYDSELMCKRLQKLPPKKIKVVSDNPKYESYTIETDSNIDFEIIGRVLYYSRIAR